MYICDKSWQLVACTFILLVVFNQLGAVRVLLDTNKGHVWLNSSNIESHQSNENDAHLMIILKSQESLRKVTAMCNMQGIGEQQQYNNMIEAGIPPENVVNCTWNGLCVHIFTTAIYGVYGKFRLEDLKILEGLCLKNEIDYVEGDQNVYKIGTSSSSPVKINNGEIFLSQQPNVVHQYSESVFFSQIVRIPDSVSTEQPQELGEAAQVTEQYLTQLEGFTEDPNIIQNQIEISEIIGSPGYKNWPLPLGLWNLDRVDQRGLPLNDYYMFGGDGVAGTGKGVTIYIVDSGIKASHIEFYDWVNSNTRVGQGYDAVDLDFDASDCDGHGTHVASVAVGRGVGLAKEAGVVGVRVLNCSGEGFTGNVIGGLDWIAENVQKPAVITLSLGLDRTSHYTQALEDAIRNLVNDGIVVVVASGNGLQNSTQTLSSCDISPAHMNEVITVGASNLLHKFAEERKEESAEGVYRFGNTGQCVDIFAPGVDIYAACGGEGRCSQLSDISYAWQSGTSMAVPHVAAAAAILMGEVSDISPQMVKDVLLESATLGQIQDPSLMEGTTDRLVYINIDEMLYQYRRLQNRK